LIKKRKRKAIGTVHHLVPNLSSYPPQLLAVILVSPLDAVVVVGKAMTNLAPEGSRLSGERSASWLIDPPGEGKTEEKESRLSDGFAWAAAAYASKTEDTVL